MRLVLLLSTLLTTVALAGCDGGGGGGDEGSPDAGVAPDRCQPACAANEECWLGATCRAKACTEDEECAPTHLCSATSQRCDQRRCSDDASCPTGEVCDRDSGRCAEPRCAGDEDCPPPEVCGAAGFCEPPAACSEAESCPEGLRCDLAAGLCRGGACRDDRDCSADRFCHDTGRCLLGCQSDEGCPEGARCDRVQHRCSTGPCQQNSDCPPRAVCLGATPEVAGRCVIGCRDDEGCPEGARCLSDDGVCFGQTCADDDECVPQQYCDGEEGCQVGCRSDAWCPGGRLCELESHVCGSAPCAAQDECAVGEYCDGEAGRCAPGCAEDLDCAAGRRCDAEHRCVGQDCAGDAECPAGDYCDPDLFVCQPGCRADDECEGQVCDPIARRCRPCGGDGDCGPERYCEMERGRCLLGCRMEEGGCPEGQICDEVQRRCLSQTFVCASDEECAPELYCGPERECLPGCRMDAGSCGPLQRCDREGRSCQAIPCAAVEECPAGATCGPEGSCIPGCASDDDCPADMPCDGALRTCGCATDEACPAGEICSLSHCTPGCRSDDECPEGQSCTNLTCQEGCRDDAREPDDSPFTAPELPAEAGPLTGTICGDDPDWLSIPAALGDEIEAELTFVAAQGDLDLELRCDDVVIAASRGEGDSEQIAVAALPSCRNLALGVLPRVGLRETRYMLRVTLRSHACSPDAGEPDGPGLGARTLLPGLERGGSLCPGDEDWYRIRLFPGSRLEVRSRGAGLLELLDAAGSGLLSLGEPEGDELVLRRTILGDGYYHLRVSEGGDAPEYTLRAELLDPVPACPDDAAEDDDAREDARELRVGRSEQAYLCPDDADWRWLELNERARLSVQLEPGRALVPEVQLWVPGEAEPRRVERSAQGEALGLSEDLAAGRYLLQIAGAAGSAGSYTLVADAQALVCLPDALEPNESPEFAPLITESVPGLTLCPGDEDWFEVQIEQGQTVELALQFHHRDGDLDMELLDDGLRVLERADSETDDEQIARSEMAAGSYFVRVYGFLGQASTNYDLVLRVSDPRDQCPPDALEPNDSAATASAAPEGGPQPAVLCSPDEDWYRLPASRQVRARIDFFHYLGDLDLDLYAADGSTLLDRSDSTSSRNYEEVAAQHDEPQVHFLRVYALGGARNDYELTLQP